MIEKLRELQKQADEQVLDRDGTHTHWSPGDSVAVALERQQKAVEALAALAPHLLPLAEALEKAAISRGLAAAGGNRREAAKLLGVSLRTLFYKLRRYNLG